MDITGESCPAVAWNRLQLLMVMDSCLCESKESQSREIDSRLKVIGIDKLICLMQKAHTHWLDRRGCGLPASPSQLQSLVPAQKFSEWINFLYVTSDLFDV